MSSTTTSTTDAKVAKPKTARTARPPRKGPVKPTRSASKNAALQAAKQKAIAANRKVRGASLKGEPAIAESIDAVTQKLREAAIQKSILRALHQPKQGIDGAVWSFPLVTQIDLAMRWFIQRQTLDEILASLPKAKRPSRSAMSRWFSQVEPHVQSVMLEDAKRAERSTEMRVARGDLNASHSIFWQLFLEATCPYLDPETFASLETMQQHFMSRVAEGASNAMKVQVEAERTRAQTAHEEAKTHKLRQLLDEMDEDHAKGRAVRIEDFQTRMRLVLGMPAHAAPVAATADDAESGGAA